MLPRTLVSVDPSLQRLREFRREDALGGFLVNAAERDYDRVFATCLDVIESLLRESGDIAEDSKLLLLSEPGRQVARIDLLLAEVSSSEDREFRRLIIVEDKLSTNSGSRRDVLAQILDYSNIVQSELTPDDFPDSVSDWVDEYRYEIHQSMRAGDFLLIICGDEIHDRLVGLVQSYVLRLDKANRSDVVLISLPIYSDGDMHILVPHVVGGTERTPRDLKLKIEVHTTEGRPLPVAGIRSEQLTTEATGTRRRGSLVDPAVFMMNWEAVCGRDAADAWRAFVAVAQTAAIPGLQVGAYASGAPYLYLASTTVGTVQVLRLSTGKPEVSDRLIGPVWDTSPELMAVRERFRRALLQLPAATIRVSKGSSRVWVPVIAVAAQANAIAASISESPREIRRAVSVTQATAAWA
jgi:hypothetical protein